MRPDGCVDEGSGEAPTYDPCNAGPGSNTNIYIARSLDGGATWTGRQVYDAAPGHQWFPWADHRSDGSLAVAWDEDVQPRRRDRRTANDEFVHVPPRPRAARQTLGRAPSRSDMSVTHWAGQYVPGELACRVRARRLHRSAGSDAEGKDCNVFHGDYTGLAVGHTTASMSSGRG